MQKFINPNGLIGIFEGSAVQELDGNDPTSFKLPVKIWLKGDPKGADLNQVDAFNILDFFVFSQDMFDFIDKLTGQSWPRRKATVFWQGERLEKDYAAIIIQNYQEIGILKANEADWQPDARYPVRHDVVIQNGIALDQELKFPVVDDDLIADLKDANLTFWTTRYPSSESF